MTFEYYNPVDEKGGCIFRSFSKYFDKDYNTIKKEILDLQKELNVESYTDDLVIETYLNNHGVYDTNSEYKGQIKDLKNEGKSIILCYNKKDFYHMVTIIDNVVYDKHEETFDLYVLKIYKGR
jgi:predicted transcriptional regulator